MRTCLAILVCLTLVACGGPRVVDERWQAGTSKRSGTVHRGKQVGRWAYRHRSGAPAAEGAFVGSMQEGPWTQWHADGTKATEGSYGAGLREGVWSYWRPDGTLLTTGAYRADRQEGPWTTYHADGVTPAAVAWFRRGIWHGPYLTFAADGRRIEAGVMTAGVRALWLAAGEEAPSGVAVAGVPGPIAVSTAGADGRQRTTRLGLDDAWVVLDAEGRLAGFAPPPRPEPPPAQPIHNMSLAIPAAELPPALPMPVDDPVLPPAAAELSPVAILPGFWTADQEAGAGNLLARYRGEPADTTGYNEPSPDVSRSRPAWHGRPLPQTRYLGSDGKVLDLAGWRGRRVVLVVMRGFSGQVCVYCATQTAALAEGAERLRAEGVETLVVYPGPPAAVPAFISAVAGLRGSPPPLPVALDAGLTLVRGLEIAGNLSLPATFILDREGLVRWTYVGTSIADRPSLRDIRSALDGVR